MSAKLYARGLNIDYFPTNFIVREEKLYYIDYECNSYMESGILKTGEFMTGQWIDSKDRSLG